MKLVNPDFLGFSIDYAFIGLELVCKDFSDPYSKCEYKKTGCYGCKHLEIIKHDLSCDKPHNVFLVPVRKDEEDLLVETCSIYTSSNDRYGRSGCSACKNRYFGHSRVKCKKDFVVKDEIIRM